MDPGGTGAARHAYLTGVACVFAAAFFFSCKAILVKLSYRHGVSPVALLALRMLFSLPFFLVLLAREQRTRPPPLTRAQWRSLVLLGLSGYYLASLLDFYGLAYVSAGLERLILFLYPTMVLLIAAFWQGRPVQGREWAGVAAGYAGIALAVSQDATLGDPHDTLRGSAWVFLSALAYAVYIAGAGPLTRALGSVRFTALALSISCAACVLHFLVTQPVGDLVQPAPVYGLALAMAVFSTVIPTLLVSEGIRRIGSGPAAIVSSVGPAMTIGLGAVILGEHVTGLQLIGMALVVGGVLWASRPRRGRAEA